MTDNGWLVINLCNNQATAWLLSESKQPLVEKYPLDFYPDPNQPDKKTKIDLAFFKRKADIWSPFEIENLVSFQEYPLIENLMSTEPKQEYLKIIYFLFKDIPHKNFPTVIFTDQNTWVEGLGQLIKKRKEGSCIVLVEKPMHLFAGYALLDPVKPNLDLLIENITINVCLSDGEWILHREGIFFYHHASQCTEKNKPTISNVENWDDLARLGTSLFYLIWKPLLDEHLQPMAQNLQNRIKEDEELLNRMVRIKQKISINQPVTQP